MDERARYAVIFCSRLSGEDTQGYAKMAQRMAVLAQDRAGYCGMDSVRDASGAGITVSYWDSEAAVRKWHEQAEHQLAQYYGRRRWYQQYQIYITRIERCYEFAQQD